MEIFRAKGWGIHLYAPKVIDVSSYGLGVEMYEAHYAARWIGRNMWSLRWRRYSAFSGTTEDPMVVVGMLSALHRRPSFTLADEIKTESFSGNRSPKWKALCRWAMRRSAFNIVNSVEKEPLQRDYLGVDSSYPMPVYPGCFHRPPAIGDRTGMRARLGIPESATVLCFSGQFGMPWGADWMVDALQRIPDLHVLGQLLGLDALTRRLLSGLDGAGRLHLEPDRLSWDETYASMAAVDIGMVVYHHPAPQFQNNGLASNRLCMFLAMGVPVVASRQPSFEFLERYDCGALASSPEEFVAAVARIRERLPQMKANATRCAREYINAPQRFAELEQVIGGFVQSPQVKV